MFSSPHYRDLIKPGAPLRFEDYLDLPNDPDGAPSSVVAWVDAPEHVQSFPLNHPKRCETSNDLPNPVQFLTSTDQSKAVVARWGGAG